MRLTDEIKNTKEYISLCSSLKAKGNRLPFLVSGLCEGAELSLAVSLVDDCRDSGSLIIMPDEKRASKMAAVLSQYGFNVKTYLYRDMLFRNMPSSHDAEYERLKTLCSLLSASCDVVVTTSDAALQLTIPPDILDSSSMSISSGVEYEMDDIVDFLEKNQYKRTEMVDGGGQYSKRGGILDIFTPGSEYPVRIEFFGNEIDSMRYFDIINQRTVSDSGCEEIFIAPCREVIIDEGSKQEIEKAITSRIRAVKENGVAKHLSEELDAVRSGRELYSADKYISLVYPEHSCLFDYCSGMQLMVFDYKEVEKRQKAKDEIEGQTIVDLLSKGEISPKYAQYTYTFSRLEEEVFSGTSVITNNLGGGISGKRFSGLYTFTSRQAPNYSGNYSLLLDDIKSYALSKYKMKLICESEQAAKNMSSRLCDDGIHAYEEDDRDQPPCSVACVSLQDIPGFDLPERKYIVLRAAESRVILQKKGYIRRKQKKEKDMQRILSYAELDVGDYVVHMVHGIGIYKGIESITIDGITNDYLKIQYAGSDELFLPCTKLDKISKYVGARSEDGTIKLSKMGGTDFAKYKRKAKASAQSMAKELINLYAERLRRPGFAFPEDDDMQKSFEAAFEYDETDGQIVAIEDIKRDMQSSVPMDRLLCGDVGYGKTEVALRAAFKAVEAGKQVAILVPTTILTLQHYKTLNSRMRGFPVRVDMISRFKTDKQNSESLRKLKRGETDIIVGTHKLLSQDIVFKDLGLLIVDEEQLFGVSHKEKLKKMSANIDVLTLSATPIPRTLNMAISGIRDISILDDPPGGRHPVQTFVTEFDDDIISEALNRELRRGGQIYYLCNRIDRMDRAAEKLSKLAPDAVIVTANGQMDKDDLSDIWDDMVNGKIDILVSTTIIEAGIDVPNANTLIIEHAERFGLSQLHQLRGRVGRSNRSAYAYFTYPKDHELSEVAEKRLEAIRDYTEFGAGFRIAMRDMEIRGAGNLLGAEQHGQMEFVGQDLFMKLLNDAVLEEKGEKTKEIPECRVDLNVNAYIPDYYITSSNLRIDAYKKISLILEYDDMVDVADELCDRFGNMPEVTDNLLKISLLRVLAGKCGFSSIERQGFSANFYPVKFDLASASQFVSCTNGKGSIKFGKDAYISVKCHSVSECINECMKIMVKYDKLLSDAEGK